MPLSPNQSIYERCEMIQRDTLAELPVLNGQNSPKLGTLCWVTEGGGQMWAVVADSADPNNLLTWVRVSITPAALLPDQRFTVGAAPYNLQEPGVDTWTTIQAGLTAAAAGTETTLGAASEASQRMVEILAGTYAEAAITLRPWVHMTGSNGAAQGVRLTGSAIGFVAVQGYVCIENVRFSDCDFTISPAAGDTTIVFRNCVFDGGVTWALSTPGGGGSTVVVRFIECSGEIASSLDTIVSPDLLYKDYIGRGAGRHSAAPILTYTTLPVIGGDGEAVIQFLEGVYVQTNATPILVIQENVTALIVTEDCVLDTQDVADSVFQSNSAAQGGPIWDCRSGTRVVVTPRSYWNTTQGARFRGGELEIINHSVVNANSPLDAVSGGTVTAAASPSNRQRYAQRLPDFNVPASQAGGGGPYGSAAAAVAAMTINAVTATTAYGDEFRLLALYPGVGLDPANGDSTLFATLFRYASYILKDPVNLEDGRLVAVKNVTDPNDNNAGPIALRLPSGSTSRVEYMQSDITVNTTFAAANYIILNPGDGVILSVDRSTPATPRYQIIART